MSPALPAAGRAAFAKITTTVLLELGLHNPLAAGIGRQGESEWELARRLMAQLPRRVVLLGDRLYGVPAFIVHAWVACQRVGSHFLFRIPRHLTAQTLTRLPDGSRRIRVYKQKCGVLFERVFETFGDALGDVQASA